MCLVRLKRILGNRHVPRVCSKAWRWGRFRAAIEWNKVTECRGRPGRWVCTCCLVLFNRYWESLQQKRNEWWDRRENLWISRYIQLTGMKHCVCVLLCFIKLILGNCYVRSRGFIVSEPRETHPRSEIADVPTLPCPPFDNLGCLDLHPSP